MPASEHHVCLGIKTAFGKRALSCLFVMVLLLSTSAFAQLPLLLQQNEGITDKPYTLHLPLSSHRSTQYLVVENPHINTLSLASASIQKPYQTGDRFSFYSRPLLHRFFIFPIPPNDRPDTLVLTLDKSGENLSFTLRLLDVDAFASYLKVDDYLIGGVLGFFLLAVFLSAGIFLFQRTAAFFFFFCYVTFSLLWIANDAGLLFAYSWPESPLWHKSSRGFFSSLTMGLFLLYLSRNPRAMIFGNIRRLVSVLLGLLLLKLVLAIVTAWGYFPDSLKQATMYFNSVTLLVMFGSIFLYLLWNIRSLWSDHFEVCGIIVYCLFVVHLASRELGWTPVSIASLHQLEVILFLPLQCVFMALQLSRDVWLQRKIAEQALVDFKVRQQHETVRLQLEAEDKERKRIAQNIHDEIGGIFVALRYHTLLLKRKLLPGLEPHDLQPVIDLADQGIAKQYILVNDLLFNSQQQQEWLQAIRHHFELVRSGQDIQLDILCTLDEDSMTPFQKTQLFRIIIELITNTIKHASATEISIRLERSSCIQLTYTDNGVGFDVDRQFTGKGLENIRFRAGVLKAAMKWQSRSGKTLFTFTIPIGYE